MILTTPQARAVLAAMQALAPVGGHLVALFGTIVVDTQAEGPAMRVFNGILRETFEDAETFAAAHSIGAPT